MRAHLARNALITFSWTGAMASYALAYQSVHRDAEALERHTLRWAHGLAQGWGLEIEAFGASNLPLDTPCVLMANHQSYADVVALFVSLPVVPVFLAKRELRSVPLFGRVMETGGHVFIDRGRHEHARASLEVAARALRPGHPLLIFPEGTRGRRPVIERFKKGGFHLARKAAVAIVPIGLRGSRDVWPREAHAARPGRIEVHVGTPISAADVQRMPLDGLVARVRSEVADLARMPLAL